MSLTTQRIYKGAILFSVGYLFLAFASVAVKLLGKAVPISVILFIQSFICLLLTMPAVIQFGFKHLRTSRLKLHLARDFGGLAWFFTFFLAVKNLPLANATLLSNTAPLWLPIISFFWLQVKIRKDLWWGVIIGFTGVIFILRPEGSGFINIDSLLALASGLIAAFTLLAMRELSQTEPNTRILFYYSFVMFLATAPFAVENWVVLSIKQWLLLCSVGIFIWLEQYFLNVAFKFAKPSTLAPLSYLRIVFAALLDWLIWKHVPEALTLIGILLVATGGVMTLYKERKSQMVIEKTDELVEMRS